MLYGVSKEVLAICTGCCQVNLMFACFYIVTPPFLEFCVTLFNSICFRDCVSLVIVRGMSVEH